jgi:hypothetical protein
MGCCVLIGWPILQKIIQEYSDSEKIDPQALVSELAPYFKDPKWVLMAFGLFTLYSIWWTLLLALADGGVYGRFWSAAKRSSEFNFREFFHDCLHFFSPMFLLLCFFLLIGIAVSILTLLLEFFAIFIFQYFAIPAWVGIFALLPAGVVFIILLSFFCVYVNMTHAGLMEEQGVLFAIRMGWRKCLENKGRVVIGTSGMFIMWLVAIIIFEVAVKILGLLPFIGLFFKGLDFIFGFIIYAFFWAYFSALAVTFSLEKEN